MRNLSGGVAMRSSSLSKYVIAGIVGAAGLNAASPAFAIGRCGGSLPVHSPTTLAEVAMRCNVNLSELYEANPSIDPSDVRPGARLAIPEEKDRYTSQSSSSTPALAAADSDRPVSTHPYIVSQDYVAPVTDDYSTSIVDAEAYRGDDMRRAHRVRVRDTRVSARAPLWLQPETEGATLYSINDRMSYQKMSALRIHNAGVPSVGPALPVNRQTKLIECQTLQSTTGGKIHQVSQIISTPERTFVEVKATDDGGGFDCRLIDASAKIESPDGVPPARFTSGAPAKIDYHLPDYSRIGVTPRAVKINEEFSLSGEVTDAENGCLLLKTSDNRLWRLAASPPSGDLLGKKVTVWGTAGVGETCGGAASMVVSHAVYAEPWVARN